MNRFSSFSNILRLAAPAALVAGLLFIRPPAGAAAPDIDWVSLPAGSFMMGSSTGSPDEAPPHRVELDSFQMARREVTYAEYGSYLKATRKPPPTHWEDKRYNGPANPVVSVTWDEAIAYAEWAGARLPSEAEWEYAARGAEGRTYPWGEAPPGPQFAVFHLDIGFAGTQPAGTKPRGATPEGLLDMAGNAFEWCSDFYEAGYYRRSPARMPAGPEAGSLRVVRGGSWISLPDACRSAARAAYPPGSRSVLIGFRLARNAPAGGR